MRNSIGLAVLTLGLGLCPSLFAVSYTWDFTNASGTSNCVSNSPCTGASAGNSITFNSLTGGPTVRATAWYLDSSGLFQKATLGQYSHGLGVCYPGETCTSPDHQTDNNALDEYILFEFSAPVDPSTMTVTSTNGAGGIPTGDIDVSYWLGGTSAAQGLNLTGSNSTTGLTGLGFGGKNDLVGTSAGQNAANSINLSAGTPTGAVNKLLFGPKQGEADDYFKVGGMAGVGSSVPEPSSVILLVSVMLLAWKASRRSKQPQEVTE